MDRLGWGSVVFVVVLSASRSHASAPSGQYVVSSNAGVVKDVRSGLLWERGHSPETKSLAEANAYCGALNLGGYSTGWRLPLFFELETLVDFRSTVSPHVDRTAFPDTPDAAFWTLTYYYGSASSGAWVVYFSNGSCGARSTTEKWWVRCVRAGSLP